MPIELGLFALILAGTVAIAQSAVGFFFWRVGGRITSYLRQGAVLQFLLTLAAFLALVQAFVFSDFSLELAFGYSNTLQPLLYKITSTWGNHEGSLLLWIVILTGFGAAIALYGKNLPSDLLALVLAVQGALGAAFIAFSLFTSNPFTRLFPIPAEGRDMNPVLQDIGMALHPPLLYLGYVGLSVCFSFAIGALISGRIDAAWARWVRPWALASWAFLTLGIAMGSYWAYYELGWGGWWFWDPVENASLMPWLAATALLHSAVVMEKRNALKVWTIFLAILAFSLSLLGMFLVRSGILTSVHSFASDPTRGMFILIMLTIVIGGAYGLFAWRARSLRSGGLFAPISREGALVVNNLFLVVAVAAVLIGTLYPLILQSVNGTLISVGAPFFDLTFGILMAPLLIIIPFGPFLAWKRGDLIAVTQRLLGAAAATVLITIVLVMVSGGQISLASLGLLLGIWVGIGAIAQMVDRIKLGRTSLSQSWTHLKGLPKNAWSTMLAHFGLGVVVLGIVSVSAWEVENVASISVGDSIEISGYKVTKLDVSQRLEDNFVAERIGFEVISPRGKTTITAAEKRVYTASRLPSTEAAILTYGFSQLYITLGDVNADGTRIVRVWYKPFITLIWFGALIMAGAGFLSLSDRRLRIGVPKSARATPEPAE